MPTGCLSTFRRRGGAHQHQLRQCLDLTNRAVSYTRTFYDLAFRRSGRLNHNIDFCKRYVHQTHPRENENSMVDFFSGIFCVFCQCWIRVRLYQSVV